MAGRNLRRRSLLGAALAAPAVAAATTAVPSPVQAAPATAYAPPPQPSPNGNYLVMPLGDSITEGLGEGSDGTGYRRQLFEMLTGPNETHNLQYVGSQGAGTPYPHEGHSGFTLEQLADGVRAGWVRQTRPQIVILLGGANDAGQAHNATWQQMVDRTSKLVDLVFTDSPGSRVVLCEQLLMSGKVNHDLTENSRKQQAYNDALPDLVAGKSGRVSIARLGIITQANLDSGGVHPNATGYRMLAWLIYQAFAPWLGRDGRYMVNTDCPFPFNPLR